MCDSNMIEDDGFVTVHPNIHESERSLEDMGIVVDGFIRHGGPQDRGAADRYYGRAYDPHYYVGVTGASPRVEAVDMTDDEIAQYEYGWDNETDRKDWR